MQSSRSSDLCSKQKLQNCSEGSRNIRNLQPTPNSAPPQQIYTDQDTLMLKGHGAELSGISFSRTGGLRLVSCSDDKTIRIWSDLEAIEPEYHIGMLGVVEVAPRHIVDCNEENQDPSLDIDNDFLMNTARDENEEPLVAPSVIPVNLSTPNSISAIVQEEPSSSNSIFRETLQEEQSSSNSIVRETTQRVLTPANSLSWKTPSRKKKKGSSTTTPSTTPSSSKSQTNILSFFAKKQ
jgi:WD40 repeat protein